MGYDPDQFSSPPDQELVCPLCYGVLEDPVQGSECDHLFCRKCIRSWLKQSSQCPVDRKQMTESTLRQPPKIILNLINRMDVQCPHHPDGCDWVIRLGDLDEHLVWCPFDPKHPASHGLKAHKGSPLKQLRVMADFSGDMDHIKTSINQLTGQFEEQADHNRTFKTKCHQLQLMMVDLEDTFKQVTDPLMKLIGGSEPVNGHHRNPEDETIRSVSINNLNEFICDNILSEYLRQQNVSVVKCNQILGYNERSRSFQVMVRQCDLDQVLTPSLWPVGVTLSVRGDRKTSSVYGEREKDLPGIVISSGMSYWHS